MAEFLSSAPNLSHLNLSKTRLCDDFAALANQIEIHPCLIKINLSNNEIGERGGILLGTTISAPSCTVRLEF